MSHVTQCPKCSTHFRVVADQLKIAEGWVRCGQCGEVFEASASMRPWPLPVAVVPESAPDFEASLQPSASPDPIDVGSGAEPDLVIQSAAETATDGDLGTPPQGPTEDQLPVLQPVAEPAPAPAPAYGDDQADPLPTGQSDAPGETNAAGGPVHESAAQNLTFVRQARRRAAWRQPWVLAVGWLFGFLLAFLLLGQVVWHERHRLAAAYPAWAPWLQQACAPFGCTLEPYRQIESVLIDSSALVRERESVYRLEVALKNTSDLQLAAPALELSLTNPADEVVLRRVLLPTDWDSQPSVLMPQATVALKLRLTLDGASDLRMAGYRALVFYP